MYNVALQHAKEDLEQALGEQSRLEERASELKEAITTLRRVVAGLADLLGEPSELSDLGITEACATVMNSAEYLLTTKDVLERLAALGFDLSSQKNAAASVGAILMRMQGAGKIRRVSMNGKPYWLGPVASDSMGPES